MSLAVPAYPFSLARFSSTFNEVAFVPPVLPMNVNGDSRTTGPPLFGDFPSLIASKLPSLMSNENAVTVSCMLSPREVSGDRTDAIILNMVVSSGFSLTSGKAFVRRFSLTLISAE